MGLSLKEIAAETSFPPSTAHRLLSTLQQEGFVRFDRDVMRWSVGLEAFSVGYAFLKDRDLTRVAKPTLHKLMAETQETANLSILDSTHIVYLAQVPSQLIMRAMAEPGHRVPIHCSAAGKAMLSFQTPSSRMALLSRLSLQPMTAKTITDAPNFDLEMKKVREQGYAWDDEEHAVGLRCLAAPVFDEDGQAIAAVSISGPVARLDDASMHASSERVLAAAAQVTRDYGGRRP